MYLRRWIAPLSVASLAIGAAAWSALRLNEESGPASASSAPALDWNDDGAFVVDPSGAPVAGAHVVAQPKSALGAGWVSLRTDERGHFRVSVASVYDIWIGADLPSDHEKPPRLFAELLDVAPPFCGQRISASPPQLHRVPVRFADGRAAVNVEIAWSNPRSVGLIDQLDIGPVWGGWQTDERGDLVLWAMEGAELAWERQELDLTQPIDSIHGGDGYESRTVNSGTLTLGQTIPALVIAR